jgi:hypothetical protein
MLTGESNIQRARIEDDTVPREGSFFFLLDLVFTNTGRGLPRCEPVKCGSLGSLCDHAVRFVSKDVYTAPRPSVYWNGMTLFNSPTRAREPVARG